MKIRNARIQDVDIITSQNIALAKESENVSLCPEIVSAGVTAIIADQTKGFYLLAEEQGDVIGQLLVTYEWSDWRNIPIWWVQSIYVQKAWRGKKVLTRLLESLSKQAHHHGVQNLRLYVHQNNTSAALAYEKLGWKPASYNLYHLPL